MLILRLGIIARQQRQCLLPDNTACWCYIAAEIKQESLLGRDLQSSLSIPKLAVIPWVNPHQHLPPNPNRFPAAVHTFCRLCLC